MDIALKMGQYGHLELQADSDRRVNEGQDIRLSMGRKMLRIGSHLIRKQDFFLPPSLLVADTPKEFRREYYAHAWDKILPLSRSPVWRIGTTAGGSLSIPPMRDTAQ